MLKLLIQPFKYLLPKTNTGSSVILFSLSKSNVLIFRGTRSKYSYAKNPQWEQNIPVGLLFLRIVFYIPDQKMSEMWKNSHRKKNRSLVSISFFLSQLEVVSEFLWLKKSSELATYESPTIKTATSNTRYYPVTNFGGNWWNKKQQVRSYEKESSLYNGIHLLYKIKCFWVVLSGLHFNWQLMLLWKARALITLKRIWMEGS